MASPYAPSYAYLLTSISVPDEVTPEKVQRAVLALHTSTQALDPNNESAGESLARSFADNGLQLQLTAEQSAKFAYGVVEYMSHPLADIPIRITASLAAGAAQAVDESFNVLTSAVDGLDAKGMPPPEGNFGPRIRAIHSVSNSKQHTEAGHGGNGGVLHFMVTNISFSVSIRIFAL